MRNRCFCPLCPPMMLICVEVEVMASNSKKLLPTDAQYDSLEIDAR
jgi:hypothetical protein